MTTAQKNRSIPPEVMVELREAARLVLSGIRDPEAMRRACERMDRMREELRKKNVPSTSASDAENVAEEGIGRTGEV